MKHLSKMNITKTILNILLKNKINEKSKLMYEANIFKNIIYSSDLLNLSVVIFVVNLM